MRRAVGFATVLAALAAAILIGLIGGRVAPYPERITASGDSFALTAAPDRWSGNEGYLIAGGYDGGAAISYLKFDVTLPTDRLPRRAWLWLGTDGSRLPDLIELSQVPDSGWREESVTAATAPRLGNVVSSVEPAPGARAVAFDVTEVVNASGVYAFAVTAPTSTELARFVAKEAAASSTGAPTITLEWTNRAEPGTPRPPTFTPSPRGTARPSPSTSPSPPASPASSPSPSPSPSASASASASPASASPTPSASPTSSGSASPSVSPWPSVSPTVTATASVGTPRPPAVTPSATPTDPRCSLGPLLVPSCGALHGVAPGAHSPWDRIEALHHFDRLVDKPQTVYHAYHRGHQLFPTERQIALTRDPANPRILFLNWKPLDVTWRQIADSDRATDTFLTRLAEHLKANFTDRFFLTVQHEPENDVIEYEGSGMTAKDYAAMFRYVITYLRGKGVTNIVSTMCYMAYVPWNTKPWFEDLYPGDDVVDWVAWDSYAYSDPGYGFGDFAEMMNRRSGNRPMWPGFYSWAARTFPHKPLMLGEWGVWYSSNNPGHHAAFFESARLQLELFPRVKAFVYFETPNAKGRDSRVHNTLPGLTAFRGFMAHPAFEVKPPGRINRAG